MESTLKDRKEINMVNLYSAKAGTWILQVLSYKIARVQYRSMSYIQNKTKSQVLDSKLQGSQQEREGYNKKSQFQREIDIKTSDEHRKRENSIV
jgi:hypothetical protein